MKPTNDQMENLGFIQTSTSTLGDTSESLRRCRTIWSRLEFGSWRRKAAEVLEPMIKISLNEDIKVVHLRPFSSRLRLFVRGLGRRVWRGGDGQ